MPQMAPISWLILFLIFTMTFIIFNIINYYSFLIPTPKSNIIKILFNKMSLNWKW